MKPTLLVLAAGMGSRYGGLKQIDAVGPNGEAILDYSVYDAIRAGFGKVVFVIRRDIEDVFKEAVGNKFQQYIPVEYTFQELDNLPEGFSVPPDRKKPWGTGHAILVAEDVINEPFIAINADDFYGKSAFELQYDFLKEYADKPEICYSMVGYVLRNTLSEHGSVSRAICKYDEGNFVSSIHEHTKIVKDGDNALTTDEKTGETTTLTGDTLVSMNFWGFMPSLFDHLNEGFPLFLKEHGTEPKSEYYVVQLVNEMIADGMGKLKVLPSKDSWFGITYTEDKPTVIKSIQGLIDKGIYPEKLWV